MTLSRYQDLFILITLVLVSFLLISLELDWTNISIGMLGFIWEYARRHPKLKERSKEHKYRFSFIRFFYFLNGKLEKIPGLVFFAPTLIIFILAQITHSEVFWAAPLGGTLVVVIFFEIKKRL